MNSGHQNYYSIEPQHILIPNHAAPVSEAFEAGLRSRLFDIMEEWEERADAMEHPALKKTLTDMIDQIDNAMHTYEEDGE